MKIARVDIIPVAFPEAPLRNSWGIHAPYAARTVVRLEADTGEVGYGETYGDQEAGSLRGLVEVSNAKSDSAGVFREAFMHAIGIDKKIANGMWLEFRLGRNRTVTDGKEQNTALMNLNLSPTLFEFKK